MKHLLATALVFALPSLAFAETMDVRLGGPQGPAPMQSLVGMLLATPGVTAVRSDIQGQAVTLTVTRDIDNCHIGPLMAAKGFAVQRVKRDPQVPQPPLCPAY